jgi:glyoxylase-like metal-dependent hydrolase (beta-lactamase superfamily II)
MHAYLCAECGTQFAESQLPPSNCPICEDDRQAVRWSGQEWITMAELSQQHQVRIGQDNGLLAIDVQPAAGIPQRAFVLDTDAGRIMWESLRVVTPAAVAQILSGGPVDYIAISHPHFYAAMVDWSNALGGVPILLNAHDERWIQRRCDAVRLWDGDALHLSDTVSLIWCPGHFPGSTMLHWTAAPGGRQALFSGDSIHVGADRRQVSVMHSVPNYVPVPAATIRDVLARIEPLAFDDLYGFSWGRNILSEAKAAATASLEHYLVAIGAV